MNAPNDDLAPVPDAAASSVEPAVFDEIGETVVVDRSAGVDEGTVVVDRSAPEDHTVVVDRSAGPDEGTVVVDRSERAEEHTVVIDRSAPPEEGTVVVDRSAPDEHTVVVDRSAPDGGTVVVERRRNRPRSGSVLGDVPRRGRRRELTPAPGGAGRSAVLASGPGAVTAYTPRVIPAPPAARVAIEMGPEATRADAPSMPSVARSATRWSRTALAVFVGACVVSVSGLIVLLIVLTEG